jgi:hypothetical protein
LNHNPFVTDTAVLITLVVFLLWSKTVSTNRCLQGELVIVTLLPALRKQSFAALTMSSGISVRRMLSVIVPPETIILSERSTVLEVSFTIGDSDKGVQFTLERKRQ